MCGFISGISSWFYLSVSAFVQISCCFGYCSSVLWLEVRYCDAPALFFFLTIVLAFGVFCASIQNLKLFLCSAKNVSVILMGTVLNPYLDKYGYFNKINSSSP